MSVASQNILDRALNLSGADKAFIIDQLRASLDQRYEAIDGTKLSTPNGGAKRNSGSKITKQDA